MTTEPPSPALILRRLAREDGRTKKETAELFFGFEASEVTALHTPVCRWMNLYDITAG